MKFNGCLVYFPFFFFFFFPCLQTSAACKIPLPFSLMPSFFDGFNIYVGFFFFLFFFRGIGSDLYLFQWDPLFSLDVDGQYYFYFTGVLQILRFE